MAHSGLKLTPERAALMAQLARDGVSVKELAAQFAIHNSTVRTYLYRGGLTPWEMREIAGKRSGGKATVAHKPLRRLRGVDLTFATKGRP